MKLNKLIVSATAASLLSACETVILEANECIGKESDDVSDRIAATLYQEPTLKSDGSLTLSFTLNKDEELKFTYDYEGERNYVDYDVFEENKGILTIENLDVSAEMTPAGYEIENPLFLYVESKDCEVSYGFMDCILVDPEICGADLNNGLYFEEGLPVHEMLEY